MIANMLFGSHFPTIIQSPVNCGAFAMLASLVIVPVVSLITKKPEKKFVDDIFSCYDRKVTVPVSEVLEEK